MRKTCKGCPFTNSHTIPNSNINFKLEGVIKVKNSLGIEENICHNNKKIPCNGMLNLKSKL